MPEKTITQTVAVAEVVVSEQPLLLPESESVELVARHQVGDQAEVVQLAVAAEQPQPVISERPRQSEHVSAQQKQTVIRPKLVPKSQPLPVVEAVVVAEFMTEEAGVALSQELAVAEPVGAELSIDDGTVFDASATLQEQEYFNYEEPPQLVTELLVAPETTESPVVKLATWLADTVAQYEARLNSPEMHEDLEFWSATTQVPEQEWPIALLRAIAVNLVELPEVEKQGLAPVLREVLAVAGYVRTLDTEEDSPTSKEQAVLRLAELCTRLLHTLEIDYEEQHLELLVAMLVSEAPSLLPSEKQQLQEIPDNVGTHEHRRFKRLIHSTDSVGYSAQRMAGSLGLAGVGLVWFGARIAPTFS